MFGSRSYVFIGLNAVRALSLIGLILVFASSIVTLVHDVKAVNAFVKAGQTTSDNSTTSTTNYEYIAYVLPFYARVRCSALIITWEIIQR